MKLPMRFHPDVVAAHKLFGGDIEGMQRRYNASVLKECKPVPAAQPVPTELDPVALEAARAAKDAMYPLDGTEAAIRAYLAAIPAVSVKGLEWLPAKPGPSFYCKTIVGTYYVCAFTKLAPKCVIWRWRNEADSGPWSSLALDSKEPALAAAQADYEARIRSALTPQVGSRE